MGRGLGRVISVLCRQKVTAGGGTSRVLLLFVASSTCLSAMRIFTDLRANQLTGHPDKASTKEINQDMLIMNQLILQDNWSVSKEKLKQKYPSLTDNDLAYILGKEDEMIDQIQRKTGESRDEIEKCLREECNG
jgi:uncharacterized protein YjbJ (UPF0337 family)